jgi:hypothetical protein
MGNKTLEVKNIKERLGKVVYLATEQNLGSIKQLIDDCKLLLCLVEERDRLLSTDERA